MPACLAPACTAVATASWNRLPTADEGGGRFTQLAERVALDDELGRARQRLVIRELETHAEDPQFRKDLLPALRTQIKREQHILSAMVDTVIEVHERQTLIAVFACDEHAVDLESRARLHEHTCVPGTCGCVTGANPLECEMDPAYAAHMRAADNQRDLPAEITELRAQLAAVLARLDELGGK